VLEHAFVFPQNLAAVVSTAVLGCAFLASAPATANWANEIDGDQLEESNAPGKVVPGNPVAPTVPGLRFNDKPFNLQLRIGASTTVGELGVVAEYDILDRINVGIGLGTNVVGLMPGAHLRLRPIVSRNISGVAVHAVFAELGLSRGNYSGSLQDGLLAGLCGNDCDGAIYKSKTVWWGQVEVGWEMRWANGILLRGSTGMAVVIAEPAWQCTRSGNSVPCSGSRPSGWAEVYTFAVGYAF
jgi:hypothetical protein